MPDLIEIICPQCKSAFAVHQSQAGTRVTCPDCLEEFVMDSATEVRTLLRAAPDPFRPSPDHLDKITEVEMTTEELLGEGIGPARPPTKNVDPPTKSPPPEMPYDFTVSCPLCGTRQDVTSKQIGRKVKCPDCHSAFKIQEPHRSARRARLDEKAEQDGDFQLSQPVASTLRSKISDEWMGVAKEELAKDAAKRAPAPSPQDVIQQTIRKANEEFEQQIEEQPEFPRHPFRTGILRLFTLPTTIGRWIVTAIALEMELSAIEMAIRSARGGGFEQVFALFFGIFAIVFGFLLFCFISTSMLVVTQHSSQGRDQITSWPGVNVLDWAFESWPMIATLFLTFAPGVLLGQLIAAISSDSTSIPWLSVGIGVISMTLFFPVLLLSFMENSALYSKPIWRSVIACQSVWLSFWLHSGTLVLLLGVLVSLRLKSGSGLWAFVLDVGILFGLLVYFRLLGRLSWASDEALVQLEARRAAQNAADSK